MEEYGLEYLNFSPTPLYRGVHKSIPTTDLMTSGFQQDDLLLTVKTHWSSQIKLGCSVVELVEVDEDATRGSFQWRFVFCIKSSLDLCKTHWI